MQLLRIIFVCFLAIGLSSCTTTTVSPQTSSALSSPTTGLNWKTREAMLSRLNRWQLNGKLAVQTAQDSGSAYVNWMQNQGQFNISLLGPLGAFGMKLNGAPGQATLQTADGKHLSATNAEELLAKGWGFHLPISYLNYWIRGLPVPGIASNKRFDAEQRLSELSQQGWHIQFLDYTHVAKLDLPNKIFITSSKLRAKIIIYQWRI